MFHQFIYITMTLFKTCILMTVCFILFLDYKIGKIRTDIKSLVKESHVTILFLRLGLSFSLVLCIDSGVHIHIYLYRKASVRSTFMLISLHNLL